MTPPNAAVPVACDIRDISLAPQGKRRIEWAFQVMPVLQAVRKQFIKKQPFANTRIAACFDLTAQTANLAVTLRDGGAELHICGARVTEDDAVASLVRDYQLPVYALSGEDDETRRAHASTVVASLPSLLLDTNGVLSALFTDGHLPLGVVETQKAGAARLRQLTKAAGLSFPAISAEHGATQRLVAERYGSGQSTIESLIALTRLLFAGLQVVVAGYGPSARSIASCAKGLGSHVVIAEYDAARALEAVLDGHRVASTIEAVKGADLIIAASGTKNVLTRDHFEHMKDGATIANAGHSPIEIDMDALRKLAASRRPVRENIEEFKTRDGRRLNLLADGKPLNTFAGNEQPGQVIDMTLANQALCLEYLCKESTLLEKRCHSVPDAIDRRLSRIKLETMGVTIERPTIEQEEYLASWVEGS